MPKFSLDAINYIITGNRQKILNLDFKDDKNDEKKNVSFFTDNESGTYNTLSTSFTCDYSNENKNEHGFVFLSNPNNIIRTLYDVKDVALKASVAERITGRVNSDSEDIRNIDNNIEIYFPHLRENPLGFAQMRQYSYGITNKTVVGPVIRKTNIYEQRNSQEKYQEKSKHVFWNNYLNPYDKFNSSQYDPGTMENLIPTYLYTPLANLREIVFNVLSSENKSSIYNPNLSVETISVLNIESENYVSSYHSFLSFFKDRSEDLLSNLFKPVYNFENIDYNYIMEVPLKEGNTTDNQYREGIVNADIIVAKNIYNDIYNTNINSVGNYKNIREYNGINAVGGKIFLTYFDDREYSPTGSISTDLTFEDYDKSGTNNVKMKLENTEKDRDYMKIECIDAINRFVSTTVHKANLYSTRVYGVDALLEDKKYDVEGNDVNAYRNNIKKDIRNSIRRIITNFVPAHTQYYDVVEFGKEYKNQNY